MNAQVPVGAVWAVMVLALVACWLGSWSLILSGERATATIRDRIRGIVSGELGPQAESGLLGPVATAPGYDGAADWAAAMDGRPGRKPPRPGRPYRGRHRRR